jgi:hypothetical protein
MGRQPPTKEEVLAATRRIEARHRRRMAERSNVSWVDDIYSDAHRALLANDTPELAERDAKTVERSRS